MIRNEALEILNKGYVEKDPFAKIYKNFAYDT